MQDAAMTTETGGAMRGRHEESAATTPTSCTPAVARPVVAVLAVLAMAALLPPTAVLRLLMETGFVGCSIIPVSDCAYACVRVCVRARTTNRAHDFRTR